MARFSRVLMLFVLLLCVLPIGDANAKSNARIAGNILNSSGSPLRDAVIKIYREVQKGETFSIARSNDSGFFKSINLAPGRYYLHVSRPGYMPVTTTRFAVDPGRTISLDIILEEFIGYISNDEDPRNWDLKTVMRSTSDRRLIFRDVPDNAPVDGGESDLPFYRSGTVNIASATSLGSESYLVAPQANQSGISSNFAYTEPVSQNSRMIFSGQLDFGDGSFWRIRDTYNYRPDKDHDYKVSIGYGRMNVNYPSYGSISSQLLKESGVRESAVQTFAFGLEGSTRFLDLLAVRYGFDYSRFHYDFSKSFLNPSIQILLTPSAGWSLQTTLSSRRVNDAATVILPDGELLNLSEPTLITMVGNRISMTQVRHSEISARRAVTEDTSVELAVYQDRIQGQGLPLMVTTITPLERKSNVIDVNEDQSSQRGMRITLNQKILDTLSGSVDYIYGDATSVCDIDEPVSSDRFDENLKNYLQQRNQHSVTGRLNVIVPITKTSVLATVRWYSGNPITPADWFSDRMDIGTKSTNFEIRQAIPIPDFLGTAGQWEFMVDLQNMLDQGRALLPATDGEIVLNRNPRSVRFGLSLNFR